MQRALATFGRHRGFTTRAIRQSLRAGRCTSRLHPRSGFSLIELMIVIVVIGILVAMLLPALNGARRNARTAQVTVDIKNLEAAIANFKLKFGQEPPSSFCLREDGSYSTSDPFEKNSIIILRQLWPDYVPSGGTGDLNGDGAATRYELNGAECLAFFLGGPGMISAAGSSSPGSMPNSMPLGFSSNPANPFATGGSRVGPFMEFDGARLLDIDGDGAPEYVDPLPNQTAPYQYFSSYNGRGYKLTPSTTDPTAQYEVLQISSDTMNSVYYQTVKGSSAPYTRGFWNPKSFQIISPGPDGEYGDGGGYRDKKFFDDTSAARSAQKEKDNITNFSGGVLVP